MQEGVLVRGGHGIKPSGKAGYVIHLLWLQVKSVIFQGCLTIIRLDIGLLLPQPQYISFDEADQRSQL